MTREWTEEEIASYRRSVPEGKHTKESAEWRLEGGLVQGKSRLEIGCVVRADMLGLAQRHPDESVHPEHQRNAAWAWARDEIQATSSMPATASRRLESEVTSIS